jgi:PKD repeat protein
MKRLFAVTACLFALALIPTTASSQYMYLDTDGDGLPTAADAIGTSGTTTLDVWLRTNSNRDGSGATCDTQDGDLTINSYEFILRATGGTVAWSGFTNHQPDFTVNLGHGESTTDYHNGQGGGTILPPGIYRLASVTVAVTLGTPSISIESSTSLSGVFLTSFGSRCSGNDFDNTLKLGQEWFDVDGAPYAGAQNQAPILTQPADMTVAEGAVAEQELTAADAEGNPVTFDLVSGPFYAVVTTVDPGTGTARGLVRLTPNLQNEGAATATVRASDGLLSDTKTFAILVTDINTAPVLSPIPDLTLTEAEVQEFTVSATDAELDLLVISLATAPGYVRITTTGYGTSRVLVSPGHADAGQYDVTVQVSDGVLTDSETFHIVVTESVPVHNQFLCPPVDMLVPQGQVAEQLLHAVSPDGNPVTFLLVSGPSYVTVSTTSSDPSSATGLVRATPSLTEASNATVQVAATDGIATDTHSFQISAGDPATLPDPAKPLFLEESRAFSTGRAPQSVAAGDLDGDGTLDLVTANLSGGLTILRGADGGRFGRRVDYPLPGQSVSAAIGDLNGDGRPDIAIADRVREVVSILYAIGECQFGRRLDLGTPPHPAHVKLADWTADGALDMVVSDEESDLISIFRGRGDGSFFAEQHFPVGSEPCYADDGDFNRDGHLDVVVANEGSNSVSVLLGNGDGTFQPQVAYQVGEDTRAVEVGDLNGDSILDLAAVNFESNSVSVLLGVGDGSFLAHVEHPSGRFPWSVAIGDLNGDSVLDLVTANVLDHTISILFGAGGGAFLPPVAHHAGFLTRFVTLEDVNEDGALDVIAVNEGSDTAVVLLGKGDGTFLGPPTFPVEHGPGATAAGDWNGDGVEDLVVGSNDFETHVGALQVHLGAGGGTFTPGQKLTDLRPTEIVTGDWNGDHVSDLAVASQEPHRLSILIGVGNGTFQPPVHHPLGGFVFSIVPVEMTGDGITDLAVLVPSSAVIYPFRNDGAGSFAMTEDALSVPRTATELAGGDWNGDGRTDLILSQLLPDQIQVFLRSGNASNGFTPMTPVPMSRRPISLVAGDFNEDQRLDVAVGTYVQVGEVPFFATESTVEVFPGDGDGTFGLPRSLNAEPTPNHAQVMDVNGDMHDDLVVTSGSGISLFLGFGNGDFVTSVDFGRAGANVFASADWSGDGRIDLAVASYFTDVMAIWINQGTFPVVANRAPVADAGESYAGALGAPIHFDGTGSSDPDGDVLAMAWSFGDGASASGPEPVHTYQAEGIFTVTLTVSDGHASGQDGTTATIVAMIEARAFTVPEDGTFRLFGGKPSLCVRIEPVSSKTRSAGPVSPSFDLSHVDLATVRLHSEGTGSVEEIQATGDKRAPLLDRDRNGVMELALCFTRDDARLLFGSVTGKQDVPVSVLGSLTDGSAFRGEAVLHVIGAPGFPAAYAAPNPMNPVATLFVATSKPGRLRAALYDASGRRVRMIADLPMVPAGVQELRFDGRSDQGTGLASGIYFYRVESAEGTTQGRISILR